MEKKDKIFWTVIAVFGLVLLVGYFWPLANMDDELNRQMENKRNDVIKLQGIKSQVIVNTTSNDYRVAYVDKLDELSDINDKLVSYYSEMNDNLDKPLTNKPNEDKLDFGDAYEKKCQELLITWGVAVTPENLKKFSMRARNTITADNLKDIRREFWIINELLGTAKNTNADIKTEKVKFVWIHEGECEYPNNDGTKLCTKCGLSKQTKAKRLDQGDMWWGMGWLVEEEQSERGIESVSAIAISNKPKDPKNALNDPNTKAIGLLKPAYAYETIAKGEVEKGNINFKSGKFYTWSVTLKVTGHLTAVEKYFRTLSSTTNFMIQPKRLGITAPSVPWTKVFPPRPDAAPAAIPAGRPGAERQPVVYGDYREPDVQGEMEFDVIFFEPAAKVAK